MASNRKLLCVTGSAVTRRRHADNAALEDLDWGEVDLRQVELRLLRDQSDPAGRGALQLISISRMYPSDRRLIAQRACLPWSENATGDRRRLAMVRRAPVVGSSSRSCGW